MSNDTRITLH